MSDFYTTYLNEVLQKLGPLERSETIQCPPGRGNYTAVALDLDCGASKAIKTAMQNTLRQDHKGKVGGVFRSYNIKRIESIGNISLLDKYNSFKTHVRPPHEKMLFHGSNQVSQILSEGFDKQETNPNGMFGAGFYFTDVSSKANQYVFGRNGCPRHGDTSCYHCERQLLLCRVIIGNSLKLTGGRKFDTAPPGYDSVTGVPSQGGLKHKEFVVYKQKQIYPEIVITYKIMR